MGQPCRTCQHPEREAIDAEIVSGAPRARIAQERGLSEPSVRRHADAHVPEVLAKAQAEADVLSAESLLADLEEARTDLSRIMAAARETDDFASQLATIDRIAKMMALRLKAAETALLAKANEPTKIMWEEPLPRELSMHIVEVAQRAAAGEYGELEGQLAKDLNDVTVHATLAELSSSGETIADLMSRAAAEGQA